MARLPRIVPPLALMGLIFFLSAQPDLSSGLGTIDLIGRKLIHMTEYGLLWFLWTRALGPDRGLLAAAITIAYAASDEFHQTFVHGRHGAPVDVLIDSAGIAIAWLLVRARTRRPTPAMPLEIKRLGPVDAAAVLAAGRLFDSERSPAPPSASSPTRDITCWSHTRTTSRSASSRASRRPTRTRAPRCSSTSSRSRGRIGGGHRPTASSPRSKPSRTAGCYGMWVLVDDDNAPARATYASAGGSETSRPHMVDWDLKGRSPIQPRSVATRTAWARSTAPSLP